MSMVYLGSKITIHGYKRPFIVAQTETSLCKLISLEDGNRYSDKHLKMHYDTVADWPYVSFLELKEYILDEGDKLAQIHPPPFA